jgi:alpha-D-xyloside xylohydrolase
MVSIWRRERENYFYVAAPKLELAKGSDVDPIGEASLVGSDDRGIQLAATTKTRQEATVCLEILGAPPRLRYLVSAKKQVPRSGGIARTLPPAPINLATDDKGASIESGGIGARITYRPYSVSLKPGPAELQADRISVDVGSRPVSLPTGFSLLEDGTTAAHLSFLAAADEHFFGLGERFLDFDRRGQRCCWNFDALGCSDDASYKNVPFFISSKHYAVFTDTTAAAYFDFCRAVQGSWSVVICDDTADLYFFGGNPRSCLAQYQETVGGAFLPPAWAFGIWMSGGFEADSADSVRQRLSELRRRGFPCDVVHIDTYWQKYGRWSDLAWNEEALPTQKSS